LLAAFSSTVFHTEVVQFNRAMRFKANKMGYSLNQRGLFQGIVRDPHDHRIKTNAGMILFLSYFVPQNRWLRYRQYHSI
jgi:hypothetical protein